MKLLIILLFLTSLMGSEIENKIDEYCHLKASVFNDYKDLYEHEYNHCHKKYQNKKLSLKDVNKLIKDEQISQQKYQEFQERKKNAKLYTKKNIINSNQNNTKKQPFNVKHASCYEVGFAYGACATRSMNNMSCLPGTNFSVPFRCRGKSDTKKGIREGSIIQQQLINQGVYK